MRRTDDRLHILAGSLGLAFGIYCFAVGLCAAAFGLADFSFLILVICIVYGCVYIVYGIFALVSSNGGMGTFMVFGIFVGTYWWPSGVPWFMWPMIIMPLVILALTLAIIARQFARFGG